MNIVDNLLDGIPHQAETELFTKLLERPGARIERIVSTGQSTPEDTPYDQDYDERVLLVSGSAGLWLDEEGEITLRPGDHPLFSLTASIKERNNGLARHTF